MMLIIISGRSGSGKSIALRVLEDIGFYCVDNIPILLLPELINLLEKRKISIAVSIDVRNMPKSISVFENTIKNFPKTFLYRLLFLDANNNTLIRRYSDTRRIHPLFYKDNLSLENAINKENDLLIPLRLRANLIIDTSSMSVHELSKILRLNFLEGHERKLTILIESFGFKYGIPVNADYVFDVRFLPNPYWDLKLRKMTGIDLPVIEFLEKYKEVYDFLLNTYNYLNLWIPMLENNNRSYLTIAIGCTGGKHRSVYIAERLGNYFCIQGKNVQFNHREL